ncbi:MAG: sugar phosphate isomerase/epimerase family protein [Nitriliruptoraceae bacterium]
MDEKLARLSLNQRTIKSWSVPEAVEGCVRAGVPGIGLWREEVADVGLETAARLVRDAGLQVTSLCRGGFFPAATEEARAGRAADNRAAVDECVALGTDVLILVCGGMVGDLDRSREQVAEGIADLAPYAGERGVRLAIEALHPMYCADRSVIVTLSQALDLAERFPAEQVGVVVDTFHQWWDPDVAAEIARAGAGGRLLGYQVCDWLDPLPDVLLGRGLPGDGTVDFAAFGRWMEAAGYDGAIEVEIFNAELWARDGDEVLLDVRDRFLTHVV